jgi:hypothetical protein
LSGTRDIDAGKNNEKYFASGHKIVATARFFGILQKNFNVSKKSRKTSRRNPQREIGSSTGFPVTAATLQSRRSANAIAVRVSVTCN